MNAVEKSAGSPAVPQEAEFHAYFLMPLAGVVVGVVGAPLWIIGCLYYKLSEKYHEYFASKLVGNVRENGELNAMSDASLLRHEIERRECVAKFNDWSRWFVVFLVAAVPVWGARKLASGALDGGDYACGLSFGDHQALIRRINARITNIDPS